MPNINDKYNIKLFAEELGVDLQSIAGLYSEYLNEVAGEIKSMKLYVEKSNWDMLGRTVHNIKGISINLNITDMYEIAKSFDHELKCNTFDNVMAHIDSINSKYNQIRVLLSDFFKEQNIIMDLTQS